LLKHNINCDGKKIILIKKNSTID